MGLARTSDAHPSRPALLALLALASCHADPVAPNDAATDLPPDSLIDVPPDPSDDPANDLRPDDLDLAAEADLADLDASELEGTSDGGDADLGVPPPSPFAHASERLPVIAIEIRHEAAIQPGVGLLDVDADDDLDLVLANDGARLWLLLNDGAGLFTDGTDTAGLSGLAGGTSVASADVDADGDPDLYLGTETGSRLFLNDGAGLFTEGTDTWGLGAFALNASAAFADFDGDGLVDLYETGYWDSEVEDSLRGEPNRLYRNTGATFALVDPSPGAGPAATLAVAWLDVDDDRDLDLWVVNDFGLFETPNALYRNDGPNDEGGWRFVDVAAELGLDQGVFGMSASVADLDNDGDFDGYVSNITNNLLLIAGPDGTFTDEAVARGAALGTFGDPDPPPERDALWRFYDPDSDEPIEAALGRFCASYCAPSARAWALTSWSSLFVDVDQDGWQDLIVVNGRVDVRPLLPEGDGQPNYLYRNRGGTFAPDPAGPLPRSRGGSRGAAVGDVDGDGDRDLIWADGGHEQRGGLVLLENRAGAGGWLSVRLRGTTSNRDALGAIVEVRTSAGTQSRLVGSEQGFLSLSQRDVHFGLGAATRVERLTVRWPSGAQQVLEDVAANRRVDLVEP